MRAISSSGLLTLAALISLPATPAAAQDAIAQEMQDTGPVQPGTDSQATPDVTGNEIIVYGARQRGSVETPQPPLLELGEQEIAAYGAGSIAELIEALGPQVNSARGRGGGGPVFLVNGVRVSGFRELRSYPPEAIEKVEVFPEEVALQFGYSADQRVVNFILKESYASREVELEYGQPFDGGYSRKEVETTYVRIQGDSRLNVNLQWNDTSLLTEAERDIRQSTGDVDTVPGDPDPAFFRSLVSDSAGLEGEVNWTTKLSETGASLSLSGGIERDDTLRLQGLDSVTLTDPDGNRAFRTFNGTDPLTLDRRNTTYALGSTLNTPLGDWRMSATAEANRSISRSVISRRTDPDAVRAAAQGLPIDGPLPFVGERVFDEAETTSDTASSKVTLIGRPLLLPAGEVSLTFDGGYDWRRITSTDTRRTSMDELQLTRGNVNGGVNLGVPITSVGEDVLPWIGDVTLNARAGVNHLSDFGTLTDWSLGLNWGVTETLSFNANYIAREAAPSLSQLGDPRIDTPNVQVFDLSRGETVLATIISGGNPDLPAQNQGDWKLGVIWELPFLERSNISFDYFSNHSEDVASGFPLLTPTIEAAFPGRVTRDATGRLISIDQRPITLAEQNAERVQLGINLSGPFGKARPQAEPSGAMGMAMRAVGGSGQGSTPAPTPAPSAAAPDGAMRERFRALRERFCTRDAAGNLPALDLTTEQIAQLPERMQEQLRGPDGQIDPTRLAEMRERLCSTEGPGMGAGERGGEGRMGNFDPARMAALRERLCVRGADGALAPLELTPELLAELPEFMQQRLRGADGQIDPERLAQMRERLCSGEGFGGRRGQQAAGESAPPQGGRGPGAQGGGGRGPGGGGGGRGFGPGGGDGRGRWFANLNYTYEINNKVLIADGGEVLDLLEGDALSGGGQPRHSANLRGGIFYRGFGLRLDGNYVGSSRVLAGKRGGTDLLFGDYVRFDARLFVDLNQQASLIEDVPLLENTRVSFSVDNIFDARQRVTDGTGTVPLRYQPFLQDPTGRFFEIELRKLF